MEVSIDIGIAASNKANRRNRRRGHYVTVVGNGEECVVGASLIRVFEVFWVRKTKKLGWVTLVSNPAHRRMGTALILAQYEPNKRVRSASHAYPVAAHLALVKWLGSSATTRRLGLATRYPQYIDF